MVLYDDFLGRYHFESLHFGKNEEVSLFDFLDKVLHAAIVRREDDRRDGELLIRERFGWFAAPQWEQRKGNLCASPR